MRLLRSGRFRWLRTAAIASLVVLGVIAAGSTALWWRLGAGPLAVDIATPWLTAALEEKLGRGHSVEVGGTFLERNEDGRTALRLHDVVVRDGDGAVVATAPKAEVGIGSSALLMGQVRAERISLIGAGMALRIDRAGNIAVFSEGEQRPLASIDAAALAAEPPPDALPASQPRPEDDAAATSMAAAALAWLASLDTSALDGHHLMEVGLQSGNLVVDDQRSGRRLNFENIHLTVSRLDRGGAAVAVTSTGADGPWSLNATVVPVGDGRRGVEAVLRDASPKDILSAAGMGDPDFEANMPLSGVVRAEIDADGAVRMLRGRIMAGAGHFGMAADTAGRILLDEAQAEIFWDPVNRVLQVPLEVHSGANRITLVALLRAPRETEGRWVATVPRGTVRLSSLDNREQAPLVLDRVTLEAHLDPETRRIALDKLDIRGNNGGIALSGVLDYAGDEPRMILGAAGAPMGADAFRRMWPVFVVPELRKWIHENLIDGSLEKLVIGTNMPMSAMRPNAPPLPEEGLAVEVEASRVTVRAVEGLPPIREATLSARAHGRMALVKVDGGVIDLPSGRKVAVSDGRFEITDLAIHPLQARSTFRINGPVDAVVELLGMGPLRAAADIPREVATAQGNVSANVTVDFPLIDNLTDRDFVFKVDAGVTDFAADGLLRGHRAEAAALRVAATPSNIEISGDMRVAGAPATVKFTRAGDAPEADVTLQATLDQAARTRLGLDFEGAVAGPVQVKLSGRVPANGDPSTGGRFAVEADLTQARVDELMPGWTKPAGRPARVSFTLIDRVQSMRLEDFVLEGSGSSARGTIELDAKGEVISANLPTFAMSAGDKASLRAERGSDGMMKITLRGDVYDGRGLVKGTVGGQRSDQRTQSAPDLDIEMRLGAMPGFHGEALRGVEMRLMRRGGHIRTFTLNSRIGQNAELRGSLRTRGAGRPVLYLETNDAGALFRFTDIYPRVSGGSMSMAMDPPVLDGSPREGLLNVQNFVVRGEPALDGMAASGTFQGDRSGGRVTAPGGGIAFSRLRAEFVRSPGSFSIREGVVMGPTIGATVEGALNYDRDQVRLRGTFVPAYALNNLFSRLPVLGMFLGGGANEGLLGVTYQVVGTPQSPVLQVNPISAVAPGFLRKLFEFRNDGPAGQRMEPDR